ncbi:MAG: SOUL family heme-binding protein [Actinomycetota bacterium]
MTEQQRYRVVEKRGDVELREYESCVVADVTVTGDVEQAANTAFRPLVTYISGANQAKASLAMTAPVIQQAAGERLAMTAPVLQEASGPRTWTVSFVLPGDRALADYPVPTNPQVTLRALPGERAAALRWSGRWSAGNLAQRTQQLRDAITEAGWQVAGEPRWARFDPPWTPPFLRRNEIVIPIR